MTAYLNSKSPSPAQPSLVSVAVHDWLSDVQVYAVLPV